MSIFTALNTYGGNWNVTGTPETLSEKEISGIDTVVVKDSKFGASMCFMLKGGREKFIPLSRDSELEVGEVVDPSSVSIVRLEKAGESPIYRADGESAVEALAK